MTPKESPKVPLMTPSFWSWSSVLLQKHERVNVEEDEDDDNSEHNISSSSIGDSSSNELECEMMNMFPAHKKRGLLEEQETGSKKMASNQEETEGIYRDHTHNKQYDSIESSFNSDNICISNGSSNKLPSLLVTRITAIASLGGILFGYDMGVIAGALPQLSDSFSLNEKQQELVVSILYVGGGVGAAVGGTLCDYFGRKISILYTDVVFVLGATMLAAAPSFRVVVLGRFVVGFGVAVSGIADVSYLHEIAPINWRGAIVSVNEACISLGFLIAFCVAVVLAEENSGTGTSWRIMFGLAGILATIQFLGMWTMPESPVWLQQQGRHQEAEKVLQRIYHSNRQEQFMLPPAALATNGHYCRANHDSDSSLTISQDDNGMDETATTEVTEETFHQDQLSSATPSSSSNQHYCATYSRQIWIALFLAVTQQFCGQTNVLNYAPILFTTLDHDHDDDNIVDESNDVDDFYKYHDEEPFYSSNKIRVMIFIGLVKFIVTVLVIWQIEHIGRRLLLLSGMTTIAMGLLFVALAFTVTTNNDPHNSEDIAVVTSTKQNSLAFSFTTIGILLVVCGYSMSFGPLTWLLTSELFPTNIRGRALGCTTIVSYGCAAIASSTFLSMMTLLGGTSRVFALYFIVTILGILFVFLAIPDTGQGQSTDQINSKIQQMVWWKKWNGTNQCNHNDNGIVDSRVSCIEEEKPRAIPEIL